MHTFKLENGTVAETAVQDGKVVVRFPVRGKCNAGRLEHRYRAVVDVMNTNHVSLATLESVNDVEMTFSFPGSYLESVTFFDVADCMEAYASMRVLGSMNVKVTDAVAFQSENMRSVFLVPVIKNIEDAEESDSVTDAELSRLNEQVIDGTFKCDIRPSDTGFRVPLGRHVSPVSLSGTYIVPDTASTKGAEFAVPVSADEKDRIQVYEGTDVFDAETGMFGDDPVSVVSVSNLDGVADYIERLYDTQIVTTPPLFTHFGIPDVGYFVLVTPLYENKSVISRYMKLQGPFAFMNASCIPVTI